MRQTFGAVCLIRDDYYRGEVVYPDYIQIVGFIFIPIILWRLWIKYKRIRWKLDEKNTRRGY